MENPFAATLLLLFLLTISAATSAPNSPTIFQEFEATIQSLRRQGYTLFTNAITTSDIQFELLSTSTTSAAATADAAAESTSHFTIFAPKDAPIFALDMSADATLYVSTLRYHIIPNRCLTFSDLRNLSSPFLDTLLPHYSVLIGKTLDDVVSDGGTPTGVMVDGSRVSDPDLFLASRIAVHGIDGILVTGLNVHNQDSNGTDNESGPLSPAEAPAPVSGFNWNIPAKGPIAPGPLSPAQTPAPFSGINSNAPAKGPIGSGSHSAFGSSAPAPGFNRNIPATETLNLGHHSPAKSPASNSGFHRKIPVEEALSPAVDKFHRNHVPKASVPHRRNIPVKGPSVVLPRRGKNVKYYHHRKGRAYRRHRRHRHHDL